MGDLIKKLSQYNQGSELPQVKNEGSSILDRMVSRFPNEHITSSPSEMAPGVYNPKYNVGQFLSTEGRLYDDYSMVNIDEENTNSLLTNMYNSFRRGIDDIQISTLKGKIEYSPFGDAAQKVIDEYPDLLRELEEKFTNASITRSEYEQSKQSLDNSLQKALVKKAEYEEDIESNERELEEEPVSKEYNWKNWVTQAKGDKAGLLDKVSYTLPQTVGSSISLMLPTLAATFGNHLISKPLSKVLGPVGGPLAALTTSVGTVFYGRHQETMGEVGSAIESKRNKLVEEYIAQNGLSGPEEIDEETMRQIRIQSRDSMSTLYWQNMALAAGDVLQAALLPMSNFGTGIRRSLDFANKVKNSAKGISDYNKATRLFSHLGRLSAVAYSEKFEEGFQYAASERAGQAGDNGLLSSILNDAYDVAASLDYSLIPGLTMRGSGRFSDDTEFQFSENSGGMLSVLLGGLSGSVAVGKDFLAYRNTKKDLITNGVYDLDSKFDRLRTSIYKKYFDREQAHHLGEAIKSLSNKKDEQGNPLMSEEDSRIMLEEMRSMYNTYEELSLRLDSISKGKAFEDDKEFNTAKEMLKEDILSLTTSYNRLSNNLPELAERRDNILAKQKSPSLTTDTSEYVSALAKLRAIEELTAFQKENKSNPEVDTRFLDKNNDYLDSLYEYYGNLSETLLEDIKRNGIKEDDLFLPTRDLIQAEADIIVNDLYSNEISRRLNKLETIHTTEQLKGYYALNAEKGSSPKSPLAEVLNKEKPQEQPETPEETINLEEEPDVEEDVVPLFEEDITPEDIPETTPEPTPVTPTPESDPNNPLFKMNKNMRYILESDKTTKQKADDFVRLLLHNGIINHRNDLRSVDFTKIFEGIKDVLQRDTEYIKSMFPQILAIGKELFENTPHFQVDENLDLYVEHDLPIIQDDSFVTTANNELLADILANEQDPETPAFKKTSGLSIASSHIFYQKDESGNFKDNRGVKGLLQFNEIGDQQLVNTSFISEGDTIDIVIDNIPEDFNINDESDENYDKVSIAIYKSHEANGIQKYFRLGHLHRIDKLEEVLALDNPAVDLETEQSVLRAVRKKIIKAGKDSVFNADISYKGFGFLNTNRANKAVTISEAVGTDNVPYLTYVDSNGDPVPIGDKPVSTVGNLKPGAAILMVPNHQGSGTVMVPTYVTKRPLKEDRKVFDVVLEAAKNFIKEGTRKSLKNAEGYIYITREDEKKAVLGKKGIHISTLPDGTGAIFGNNRLITMNNIDELSDVIGSTYFSLNKIMLKSPKYVSYLKQSPLLATSIVQNPVILSREYPGEKFSYFSQHTINFENIRQKVEQIEGPQNVIEEPGNFIEKSPEEAQKALDEINRSGIDLDFFDDFSATSKTYEKRNLFDDISSGIKSRLLVSSNIPASVQQEMVDSIAFMLLKNTKDDSTSNVDKVRGVIENNKDVIEKNLPKLKTDPSLAEETKKAEEVLNNYRKLLDNFDLLVDRAKKNLEKIGFKYDEDTDYYENLEERGEENAFVNYDEESDSQRNAKDFLPSEVKMLLYFIPKVVPLDLTNEKDRKRYERDDEKKPYKPASNSLGLPLFNNFNDTWEKTLEVVSNNFYSSDATGLNNLITDLKNEDNPYIVQELARNLEKAKKQVKKAFFRRLNLQNQRNTTLLYNISSFFKGVKKKARLILSDRRKAEKNTFLELENDFRASSEGVLSVQLQPGTQLETYVINTTLAKQIKKEAEDILNNPASYSLKGLIKDRTTGNLTEDAKKNFYKLIRRAGINIYYPTFVDVLKNYRTSRGKSDKDSSIIKELFINGIFATLAGEKSKNKEENFIDYKTNNPFFADRSILEFISKQEYKYRPQRQSGAYRFEGKSFYSYTRHHYLSEFFVKLEELKTRGKDYFVSGKLNFDFYARRSRILRAFKDPSMREFVDSFKLFYELGVRNESTNNPAKRLKDMSVREHQVTKLALFQNQGRRTAIFMYDTLSDKATKPYIQMEKVDIEYELRDRMMYLSEGNLEYLFNYFLAEYDRIKEVSKQNRELEDFKKIEGYHDIGSKEGVGKYFNIYYYLNKDVLDADIPGKSEILYNSDGTLKDITPEVKSFIFERINSHFNKVLKKHKQDFAKLGIYSIKRNPVTGESESNLQDLVDHDYLFQKGGGGVIEKVGLDNNPGLKAAYNNGEYDALVSSQNLRNGVGVMKIVNHAIADYVYNYMLFSNEMLMITGDPAQGGKHAKRAEIEKRYADNPVEGRKQVVLQSIKDTFVNIGKRNASFVGSGEKGSFNNPRYTLAIANDISISSNFIDLYKSWLPERTKEVDKAFNSGDLTDAQEVTTVKEHLTVMEAYGQISEEDYMKALYIFDRDQYNKENFESKPRINSEDISRLRKLIVLQPMKPVQRTYMINEELKISKQFYVKTSSYPLIPSLIKGTPLEDLLNDMKEKGVDRIAFKSGVKQGVSGSKDLFDSEGNYNKSFFENNINELDRSGFRIQQEVPFKEDKSEVREGTQLSKLLFVDIPDDIVFQYKNRQKTTKELKELYRDYHEKIVKLSTQKLLKELDVQETPEGLIVSENTFRKLSEILQEEGLDRNYSINSLLGLDINEDGVFKIPLTFLPNAGQIEPVITAIVSNRVSRIKMPGKSYVQGSEFSLRRGQIKEGEDLDRRNIIWTKPEYSNISKLNYLHTDEEGNLKPAQIVMPFYFVDEEGNRVNIEEYITEKNGVKYLNTNKIDPELLGINGFRIPFQGHNSGMWFEIVGFLPYEAGDLILVPGEIAGQMGSDYDVDKLYTYNYHYKINVKSVKRPGKDESDWRRIIEYVDNELKATTHEKGEDGKYDSKVYKEYIQAAIDYFYPGGNPPYHEFKSKIPGSKYSIQKIDSMEPSTVEEYKNALIDINKAIFTSNNPDIIRSIMEPQAFDDVKAAVDYLGSEGMSEFLGTDDSLYQRDVYFSNITGKDGTAISANANTSHAMSQSSNLYIKGEGFHFLDESGNIYKEDVNTNRVNEYSEGMYTFYEGKKVINRSEEAGEYRLDKIYTFPSPVTGKRYKISNLISQVLGVSVDNAKEQMLGAFGINKQNFNVALSIVRGGFDLYWVKAFINQPILKEYYETIGEAEDIFIVDYTINKKEAAIQELFKKYVDKFNLSNTYGSLANEMPAFSFEELKSSLGKSIEEDNAAQQIKVLYAFLKYKDIADSLQNLSSTFNIDTKGLAKNMSGVLNSSEKIHNIIRDSQELPSFVLGNVERFSNSTIPGIFNFIPGMTIDIFMNRDNPMFAYGTSGYINTKSEILNLAGKKSFYSEQVDLVHRHIKQYIYSGFENPSWGPNRRSIIRSLVFDNATNKSLTTRLRELKDRYSRNELIDALKPVSPIYPENPSRVEIQMSNEDDFVQKISEQWEHMLYGDDVELKSFAEDLVKYVLYVSPQEYGTSSIVRYIPFSYLEQIGFTNYLTDFNKKLGSEEEVLMNFSEQFIRHNPDFLPTVKEIHFEGRATYEYEKTEDGVEQRAKKIALNAFNLPEIESILEVQKSGKYAGRIHPAANLVRVDDESNKFYPTYLSFYNNEKIGKQIYKGSVNPDGSYTYVRIEKLGELNMTEYSPEAFPRTNIGINRVAFTLPETDSKAVLSAMQKDRTISDGLKGEENSPVIRGDYLEEGRNIDNILSDMIVLSDDISSNTDMPKKDRFYAGYFGFLAKQLQYSGLDKVSLTVDRDLPANASTSEDGLRIIVNPDMIANSRKSGLSQELEKQRIVLHELVHAKIFREISDNIDKHFSPEYERIYRVWEAYRSNIQKDSKETLRGIPKSLFEGELMTYLYSEYRDERNEGGSRNFGDFVQESFSTVDKSMETLANLGKRLSILHEQGKISKYNFDLTSNSDRLRDFQNYMTNEFFINLNSKINKYIPYVSLQEFIAEAMTNNKTQEELRKMPSLWKEFINSLKKLISKLLGVDSEERTLLDDALDAVFNFLNYDKNSVSLHEDKGMEGLQSVTEKQVTENQRINVPLQEKSNMTVLKNYTNHSGGALGADSVWEDIGKEFGMLNNKHYYHGAKTPRGNTKLTDEQLNEGWQHVLKANKTLNRRPENYKSLLSRNWYQVKNADAVFAISSLQNNKIVNGGTGWAVQMSIDNGKPTYVFDQKLNQWYVYNNDSGVFVPSEVPILTQNFAGIGTREINENGRQAIRNVYVKTATSIQPDVWTEENIDNVSMNFHKEFESTKKSFDEKYKTLDSDSDEALKEFFNSSFGKGFKFLDIPKGMTSDQVEELDKDISKYQKNLSFENFERAMEIEGLYGDTITFNDRIVNIIDVIDTWVEDRNSNIIKSSGLDEVILEEGLGGNINFSDIINFYNKNRDTLSEDALQNLEDFMKKENILRFVEYNPNQGRLFDDISIVENKQKLGFRKGPCK